MCGKRYSSEGANTRDVNLLHCVLHKSFNGRFKCSRLHDEWIDHNHQISDEMSSNSAQIMIQTEGVVVGLGFLEGKPYCTRDRHTHKGQHRVIHDHNTSSIGILQ